MTSIEKIKELFLSLTWSEMERLTADMEEWRTADGEGHTHIDNSISGDWLIDWAMNSVVK